MLKKPMTTEEPFNKIREILKGKGKLSDILVVDGVVAHKNMNPELGVPTICVVWDGQRDISKSIICNKEKLDIGGKMVDESEVPHFTLV